MSKTILITGSAGFIGFHLALRLLKEGFTVTGIDNLNNYYDSNLKDTRLKKLKEFSKEVDGNYTFRKIDIANKKKISNFFMSNRFDIVINLAAQAGVRYSIKNPSAYMDSNLSGFLNILEGCRYSCPEHFIFASSSSVYGMNNEIPFSIDSITDYPVSLYAATKKSNELMAFSYSHLFKIPTTGLRFFTVYGPYGRPDMAYFKFTKSIFEGKPIEVFNEGNMMRDFTFIDDVVEGLIRVIEKIPDLQKTMHSDADAKYKLYNIGNNNPIKLSRFIEAIEKSCGKNAIIKNLPMQAGDVPITYANVEELMSAVGFKPNTSIEDGIEEFVRWYKEYV